jgi:predicted Rossmann-fold nucleotide-binding protein
VVAPGGVGTLEEAIEVLSWKRLDLHTKPVIFLNLNGFWEPLLSVMEHSIAQGMTPPSFRDAWVVCDTVEAAIAAVGTAGDMPHLQYDRR